MSKEDEGCRTTKELMNLIANHLIKVADKLDSEPIADLVNEIMIAKKIFLLGAGRSGFVARAFAMRLMHLGFEVYAIGDVTMTAVKPGDLVIAVSGTGRTVSIVNAGKAAKGIGATLASITSEKNSPLADNSDIIVIIPGNNKEDSYETKLAPLGTMFELTALVFLDGIISDLKVRKGVSEDEMNTRHLLSEHVGML